MLAEEVLVLESEVVLFLILFRIGTLLVHFSLGIQLTDYTGY